MPSRGVADGRTSVTSGAPVTQTTMTPASTTSRSHRAGIAAVATANIFWSFGGTLGKKANAGGVVLSFWRMWIAAAIMLVVCLVMRRMPTWRDLRRAAPLGVLFGLNIVAFFVSLDYVSVAVALVIGALTPVVALPVAVLFMGERLSPVKIGCAVVAVAGVVVAVLSAPDEAVKSGNRVVGYTWAVLSLIVWVAYLLVSKRVRADVETVRFMFVMSFVGGLTVTILVLVNGADLGRMQGLGWLWTSLLAIGPGLMGHGLVVWAQPRVDASVSALLIQAEPVGAAIAAWVFLGERMTLLQGIAMGAVLVSLAVLGYREARDVKIPLDEAMS